jgi:hypothetical protein
MASEREDSTPGGKIRTRKFFRDQRHSPLIADSSRISTAVFSGLHSLFLDGENAAFPPFFVL